MNIMKRIAAIVLAVACVTAGGPASAAQVIKAYDFAANTLLGPTLHHQGSFSFSYDDADFVPTLLSIDFSIGSTEFSLANTGMTKFETFDGEVRFMVGGAPCGPGCIFPGKDDFYIVFSASPTGRGASFAYSQQGFDGAYPAGFGWGAEKGDFSLTPAAIPEPGTWALLILGFGLVGSGLRARLPERRIPYPNTAA